MKSILAVLLCVALPALAADDAAMRLSGRMLFPAPELAKPGACVMYREGGAGWVLREPEFWLKGVVIAAEIRSRRVERCIDSGKPVTQLTRDEFNRLATAQPCVSRDDLAREESWGAIRLRVDGWETPHARKLANAGRLYQGHYLAHKLEKGGELEIDATLLRACE